MPRVLVIAYGNPLRSDDGLAWIAADLLQKKVSDDEVEVLCVQQLGPELADSISRCECVFFIDAASTPGQPGEIRIQELSRPVDGSIPLSSFGHAISPQTILRVGAQLYGAKPTAFSATIVGANFEHGESLSATAKDAIPILVSQIVDLIGTNLKAKPEQNRK